MKRAQATEQLAPGTALIAHGEAQPIRVGIRAFAEGTGLHALGAPGVPHGGGEPGHQEALERTLGRQLALEAAGKGGEVGVVVPVEQQVDPRGQAMAQRVARCTRLAALADGPTRVPAIAPGALGTLRGGIGGKRDRVGHGRSGENQHQRNISIS